MRNSPQRPTVIDIFAGIGGLSHGFREAGAAVVAAVEWDGVLAGAYAANHPEVRHLYVQDIKTLNPKEVLSDLSRRPGQVTFLVGGPPCQGFSHMGKRKLSDQRNDMLFQFTRYLGVIQPEAFVLENVPGLMSSGTYLKRTLERIERAGYKNYRCQIVNAADAGVPQRRKRVIIYGTRDQALLPDLAALSADERATVGDAFDDLPSPFTALREHKPNNKIPYLRPAVSSYARMMRGASRRVTRWEPVNHSPKIRDAYAALRPGETDSDTKCYRLVEAGLARTLRAGSHTRTACRPVHPTEPRVITIREAARLHSFPDRYILPQRVSSAHMGIGNAVPPLMARQIAGALMNHLGFES